MVSRRAILALPLALPFVQQRQPTGIVRVRDVALGWTVVILAPDVTGQSAYDVLFQHDASGRIWAERVTQQELYTRRWPVTTWAGWMIPQLPMSPVAEM